MTSKQTATMDLKNVTIKLTGDRAVLECDATPEVKALVEPGFSMWKPETGQQYWSVNEGGWTFNATNDDSRIDRQRIEEGNCYPTANLAEAQRDIDRITRKLNQAVIAFGGALQPNQSLAACKDSAYAGLFADPAKEYIGYHLGMWFKSGPDRTLFAQRFHADLTRLAELNASLTKGWSEVLTNSND
jgi:hypothetical protein